MTSRSHAKGIALLAGGTLLACVLALLVFGGGGRGAELAEPSRLDPPRESRTERILERVETPPAEKPPEEPAPRLPQEPGSAQPAAEKAPRRVVYPGGEPASGLQIFPVLDPIAAHIERAVLQGPSIALATLGPAGELDEGLSLESLSALAFAYGPVSAALVGEQVIAQYREIVIEPALPQEFVLDLPEGMETEETGEFHLLVASDDAGLFMGSWFGGSAAPERFFESHHLISAADDIVEYYTIGGIALSTGSPRTSLKIPPVRHRLILQQAPIGWWVDEVSFYPSNTEKRIAPRPLKIRGLVIQDEFGRDMGVPDDVWLSMKREGELGVYGTKAEVSIPFAADDLGWRTLFVVPPSREMEIFSIVAIWNEGIRLESEVFLTPPASVTLQAPPR